MCPCCFVCLWHPPHCVSATQLLLVFQNPVPCWLPIGFSGSPPLGWMSHTIWLYYQFHVVSISACLCHKFLISSWASWSCPQRLMISWEQNLHLKVWSDLRFVLLPIAKGRVGSWCNPLGKSLTVYTKIFNNIYFKRIYTSWPQNSTSTTHSYGNNKKYGQWFI